MVEDLLADIWDAQQKDLKVFNKIDHQRVLSAIKKSDEHSFKGLLYPSKMSWSMCVADHIYQELQTNQDFPTRDGEEARELGNIRHREWQEVLVKTNIFAGQPNYPEFIKERLKTRQSADRQNEIYIGCDHWFISAWIDGIIKETKDSLSVIDFKTKNVAPERWEKTKETFPLEREETQLYIYMVLLNKYEYYSLPTTSFRLCYYNNPCFKHASISPKYELFRKMEEDKYQKTIDLLDEGRNQMIRFKEKEPKICRYKYCNKHSEKLLNSFKVS